MGDALRGQGKDSGQLELTLNADSTLGFSAPGWGNMELQSQAEEEQTLAAAPDGIYCGSVPLTLDMGLTFHGTGDIGKKVIECKAEAEIFDASSGAVPQTMQTGACMGDTLQVDPGGQVRPLAVDPLGAQVRPRGPC